MGVDQKLLNELNLCYTQRWVVAPLLRQQSVAEHCYRVQAITRALFNQLPAPGSNLDRAILFSLDHDHKEAIEGDIPGTAKDLTHPWVNPSRLLTWEIVVKVADALECYDYWQKWGNPNAWVHPHKPPEGANNRDIRKVRWFCGEWTDLIEAVEFVMEHYLGYSALFIKEVLCRN